MSATMVAALRAEVRDVIEQSGIEPYSMCDAWMRGHDLSFTKALAEAGLIGLSWPEDLGGRQLGYAERLVVTEELLKVGAPVAAHWIADRQIGPAILRYGGADLQRRILPGIANGTITVCLGMSESESGSDLAAVRTRAVADRDGFRLTGRKIWTSHAHRSTHAYVLARTSDDGKKHEGLTEFIVDLSSPGIEVRPILDLAGEHHFNETIFDDVLVPACNVIGEVGSGWRQVTEQLSFERGGMERVLSTYPLLAVVTDSDSSPLQVDRLRLGELAARLGTLRAMAHGVATDMDAGLAPIQRAAMLKYLGTTFEGDVIEFARTAYDESPDPNGAGLEGLLATGIYASPGATLRGGTTEVLLGIIAKQELAAEKRRTAEDDLRQLADEVLREEDPAASAAFWGKAVTLGWTGVGVDEQFGGSGGELADLATIATALGRHAISTPVISTAVARRILADASVKTGDDQPIACAFDGDFEVTQDGSVSGTQRKVRHAREAESILVAAKGVVGEVLVRVPAAAFELTQGTNLAAEARDTVTVRAGGTEALIVGGQAEVDKARNLSRTMQSAEVLGSLEGALESTKRHVSVREQFGRPLAAFQAVAHGVARMAAEVSMIEVAVMQAVGETEAGQAGWRGVAARVVAARAATEVAKTAHQLLGAMGITQEHELHMFTLRLLSWRDESGSARMHSMALGSAVADAGPEVFWDWLVQATDVLVDPDRMETTND